jgi:transcriptional regulator with XRE-family HTH domain
MPTQQQIAEHLDISQQQISELMKKLNVDWQVASLDEIRVAYIRGLRSVAAGHRSSDGLDLTHERVLTERVDRELKQLLVAEKKGVLINVEQLEPELMNMISAFRGELLARDDKLKADLDALYAIDLDLNILNEHTHAALSQLARYEPGSEAVDASAGACAHAAGADEHGGMGAAISRPVIESIGETGAV